MPVTLTLATPKDAASIAALLTSAANMLTVQYGTGHWSHTSTEKSVLQSIRTSRVYAASEGGTVVGTFALTTKKPWAIDTAYFTTRTRPVYLLSMAVSPVRQGRGIGRACVEAAKTLSRDWPAEVIRLDAYDALAGAGPFYEKCGFRDVGHVLYKKVPLIYFELLL
jgi:GNAT superfamily N-acetyltransferase